MLVTRKNIEDGEDLDPAEAASLFNNVKKNMKKRTKPVPAWETAGRGLKADPKHLMDTCIQPNYPQKI